jgi:hypothetical protein
MVITFFVASLDTHATVPNEYVTATVAILENAFVNAAEVASNAIAGVVMGRKGGPCLWNVSVKELSVAVQTSI